MTQRLLIADDEPLARERLRRLAEELPGYEVCAEAGDGDDVLKAIADASPDILLLDIRMPGLDGLEAADTINRLDHPPAIIFCTAYDEYAIDAFRAQAVDYLLKPVRREHLESALGRAGHLNRVQIRALQESARTEPEQITVRTHRGTELIDLPRIYFCEADQKCVTLHHDQGETVTDFTLKELEQAYPDHFLRIHRHTLAGTRHIQGLTRSGNGQALLKLRPIETPLQVSRRHQPHVREWIERQDKRSQSR
ncbi:LytTR family two component transcriptional regulator [Tamilnaduibacter salinus]|uniref:LytTR family two component transcriptional regulator n=1 Tax=Tamilnaduibacter salinus TaxID=1484056 RepID=A0A2U1CXI2_9GAMM|nr:LytTR family DNA-binding domain-containing protein [Tamilnaduibacter salinus]PVY76925.1 LytTR family two component transcriptional regulator [Tamilnaduibacter salinus]